MSGETKTCPKCHGTGGKTETSVETRGGVQVTSQTWRPCTSCNGTGRIPA